MYTPIRSLPRNPIRPLTPARQRRAKAKKARAVKAALVLAGLVVAAPAFSMLFGLQAPQRPYYASVALSPPKLPVPAPVTAPPSLPFVDRVIAKGTDSARARQGSSKAFYSLQTRENGDKVVIRLTGETSKQGTSGRSKAWHNFLVLDADGQVIMKVHLTQTVGADFLRGKKRKSYKKSMTLIGEPARDLIKRGGTVAVDVELETTKGTPSNLKELADDVEATVGDLQRIFGSLSVANAASVGRWKMEKIDIS